MPPATTGASRGLGVCGGWRSRHKRTLWWRQPHIPAWAEAPAPLRQLPSGVAGTPPWEGRQVGFCPAGPRGRGGQRPRGVVPGQQALVQQRRVPVGEAGEVGARRDRGHVVADDLRPGPGDRGVELLRGALVRREVPEPAGNHLGGPASPVPLHREVGEMDVLAVAERAARRDDLRQGRGQFRRQGAIVQVMWAVRVVRAIGGHPDTSVSASIRAWKPARCAVVTVASAGRSRSAIAAAACSATARPAGVSEIRNERRSAWSSSRLMYPCLVSRSSRLVSVLGLVAVAVASAPTVRPAPSARMASTSMSAAGRFRSASAVVRACKVAWVARCRASITLPGYSASITISDYTISEELGRPSLGALREGVAAGGCRLAAGVDRPGGRS